MIIAVTNQKGGVGKTTTQANATSGLGCKGARAALGTIYDALTAAQPSDPASFVVDTSTPGLSLIPASRELAGAEIELITIAERERRTGREVLAGRSRSQR